MPLRLRATPQKYRSKAKVVDGIRFASTKEANFYLDLKLLEKAGQVTGLILQPEYELRVRAFAPTVRDEREVVLGVYRADFSYYERGQDTRTVVDVKGFRTPLYKWKRKHTEAQYGLRIVEV